MASCGAMGSVDSGDLLAMGMHDAMQSFFAEAEAQHGNPIANVVKAIEKDPFRLVQEVTYEPGALVRVRPLGGKQGRIVEPTPGMDDTHILVKLLDDGVMKSVPVFDCDVIHESQDAELMAQSFP